MLIQNRILPPLVLLEIGSFPEALEHGGHGPQKSSWLGSSNMSDICLPPEAVAPAITFAIEQPPDVEIGDIMIRPPKAKITRPGYQRARWNCYCGRFLPR